MPRMKDRSNVRILYLELPIPLADQMERSARQNHRSLKGEAMTAFEHYLKAIGMWPPSESAEPVRRKPQTRRKEG
jgi:hypothetical protein